MATTALADASEAMRLVELSPGQALPVAERAARRARRERDPAARAIAERALGRALLHCGDMDGATRRLRRAVACGQQAGSVVLTGQARVTLAFALMQRGRPDEALAEIDEAMRSPDEVVSSRARAQRGIILRLMGRPDEALAEFHTALTDLRRAGYLLGVQRTLVNRGLTHIDLHEFTAAEADLVEADRLARELGRGLSVGIIAENLALVEGKRGNVPAALAHLERAQAILGEHGAQLGPIYRDRAELLLSAGLVSEARTAAEQAIAAHRQQRRELMVPEVRLLLAQAAYLDYDWPVALDHARRAQREFTRQQRAEWAEMARLHVLRVQLASGVRPRIPIGKVDAMVETMAGTGWPAAALEAKLVAAQLATQRGRTGETYLSQASQAARRRGPVALRARGWYAQALLRLGRGNPSGATSAARAGLRILDEHSAALGATDLRAHAAVHRTELTELGLRIALNGASRGRPARVFKWAERGRARQLLHRPARPPDDPELARMLTELRATAVEIDQLRDDGRSFAKLVARQVALERRIRDHRRLYRGEATTPAPGPVSVTSLSQALADWALVEYVQLAGELHALTVVEGQLRLRPLGLIADAAALIERLPFALHRLALDGVSAATKSAALTLLRQAAEQLDAMLLGQLAELAGRPLVVVPTGPLHSMPWSVLPSCAGRPLTVSPSATLWHATATRRLTPAKTVLTAAGPQLNGAREEASAVAAIHQPTHRTTALLDDAATVDAVLGSLAEAGLAHLAAHGRLSSDNPLFSDLMLADGPLIVYDLERLARVPDTVILAACDSGRSVVCAGDELLGLSATFLGGGTAALIASVVPVPDVETAPLMIAFHRRLAAGEPPAVALAAAQQQLSAQGPADIAAAAGFICIGTGLRQ